MRVFHSWDTFDWTRISLVVAAITAFWVGLAAILPEKYHKMGMVILGSAQSALTLMMRSGKSRGEKIEEKIDALETKKEETRIEVTELISKEAAEQAAKQDK